MALSGVVFAGTGTVTTTSTSKTESVIATSELTLEALKTIITGSNTNLALLGVVDNGGNAWSISVGTWSSTSQLHIYTKKAGESISGNANGSFTYSNGGATNYDIKTCFTNLDNAVKGSLTLGYQGSNVPGVNSAYDGTSVVLSVLYNDGTIVSLFGNCDKYKNSSNYITSITYADTMLAAPEVTVLSNPWSKEDLVAAGQAVLIPEPTTATLSLLALAGLAARRRRR